MVSQAPLSPAAKLTISALVVAAGGVVMQIASGAPYPRIPPVFFILLIPAALIALARQWWTPLFAIVAGLFLTFGLFAAGEAGRLTNPSVSLGDSIGLWMQMVAVLVAIVGGILATRSNLRERRATRG